MVLTMAVMMAFTACSEDKENSSSTTPAFPTEVTAIACNAGETKTFTFTANMDWVLTSSDITWCKFVENDTEKESLSGSAGTINATIKVTSDGQTTETASVAKLDLTMGGQTATIAQVTRSALGYELKIYDTEGNEVQALEIGYGEFAQFVVKGNYRYAVSSYPDWVTLEGGSLTGTPNESVTGGLQIVENEDRKKYAFEASDNVDYSITFSDEAGKAVFSFPLYFNGMDEDDIKITRPSNNRYNWTVSLDGKTFVQEGTAGSSSSLTYNDELEFTITALEDEYEIVFMEKGNDGKIYLMDPTVDEWMKCTKDKGTVKLTINELDPTTAYISSRDGYVLALPKATYDNIKDNLESVLTEELEDGTYDIAYAYQNSSLLIAFTQKDTQETEEQGFIVLDSNGSSVTVEKVTETSITENWGTEQIYSIQGDPSLSYSVYPLMSDEEFTTIYEKISIVDANYSTVNISSEPSYSDAYNSYYMMYYYSSANISKDIYIQFPNSTGDGIEKILIIKAGESSSDDNVFIVTGSVTVEALEDSNNYFKNKFGI